MFLSNLSIKHPLRATMIMAALAVLGIASYQQLKIDFFPKVEIPVVTVTTIYPGAGPETVEREVTKKIEEEELLAAAGALGYFQGKRAREADRAFRDALTTFEAPVASELPAGADRPSGQVFAAAEEKYKTAAAAFEGVERRFGSSKTGLRAKYYAGLSRLELGQHAEAEKALKEVQAQGAGLEPELARVALANLYRRSGQVDKAVEAYRGLAANPSANLPRDFALLSAAQTLEDAKRWAEARAVLSFNALANEYAASARVAG